MTEEELKILKEKYDEKFLKYWSKRDGSSKFQPISMEEFKKRLKDEDFKNNLIQLIQKEIEKIKLQLYQPL